MKVKAKVQGQYRGVMVHPGDIFDIEEDANYPAPWMEPLEANVEAPKLEELATQETPDVVEVPEAPKEEFVSSEQKTKKKRWFK